MTTFIACLLLCHGDESHPDLLTRTVIANFKNSKAKSIPFVL